MSPLTSSQERSSDSSRTYPDTDSSIELISRRATKTLWRACPYTFLPKTQRSLLCCCSPKLELTTPITDKQTWEHNIEQLFHSFTQQRKPREQMTAKLQKKGLETTSIPARIAEAISLYSDDKNFVFLSVFKDIHAPKEFYEKYSNLTHGDKKRLLSAIGGKEPLEIVQIIKDSLDFTGIFTKVDAIAKRIDALKEKKFSRPSEKLSKIAQIQPSAIPNTFRAFWDEEHYGIDGYFFLQGDSLKTPKLEGSPEYGFMEWIIQTVGYKEFIFRSTHSLEGQTNFIRKNEATIKNVPSLPLLKACSFGAWAQADNILRIDAFPSLFLTKYDEPCWRVEKRAATRFYIDINDEGHFKVTQVKQLTLINRTYNKEETGDLETLLGTMDVCWELSSDWKGEKYNGELSFRDLNFTSKINLLTAELVLDQMGL